MSEADHEWMRRARCAGTNTESWFPPKGGRLTPELRELCNRCPVIDACAEYAIARPELSGVWGGMSELQRRQARRTRERSA